MITFVTPRLAIGSASDARNSNNSQFDAILNVAIDLDVEDSFKWRHKVGLLDGPGNSPLIFMSAVLLLYSLLKEGKRVLVHCHEGKSRSVMVAATLFVIEGRDTLDEALDQIMPKRGVDIYRKPLYDMAESVIPLIKELVKDNNIWKKT